MLKSWAIKRYVNPNKSCKFSSRLTTWAWMEISNADIGSSRIRNSGCKAIDRATLMRWSLQALDAVGGPKWLKTQADKRPVAYLQLMGRLLPRESTINTNATPEGQYSQIVAELEAATKRAEEMARQALVQAQAATALASPRPVKKTG